MAATQVELDVKAAPQWVTTKKGTLDVHFSSLANKFQLRKWNDLGFKGFWPMGNTFPKKIPSKKVKNFLTYPLKFSIIIMFNIKVIYFDKNTSMVFMGLRSHVDVPLL